MEYTLINTANNKTMGRIWWDGKAVQAEPSWVKTQINSAMVHGKVQADGMEFMKVLPFHYRSGYLRLVKKE